MLFVTYCPPKSTRSRTLGSRQTSQKMLSWVSCIWDLKRAPAKQISLDSLWRDEDPFPWWYYSKRTLSASSSLYNSFIMRICPKTRSKVQSTNEWNLYHIPILSRIWLSTSLVRQWRKTHLDIGLVCIQVQLISPCPFPGTQVIVLILSL